MKFQEIKQLVSLAIELKHTDLVNFCIFYISDIIDNENVFEIIEFSWNEKSLIDLYNYCRDYINQNKSQLEKQISKLKNVSILCDIIINPLSIPEIPLPLFPMEILKKFKQDLFDNKRYYDHIITLDDKEFFLHKAQKYSLFQTQFS